MNKWVVVLVLLLSLSALAGCGSPQSGVVVQAQGSQEEGTPPVVKKENSGAVVAEAAIEPARSSSLSFEIPGDVVEVLVETGDTVRAGQPLARLDTRELALALRSAEQDLRSQEAALQQLLNGASPEVIARADKGNRDQVAQAEVALKAKQLLLDKARAEDPALGVSAAQAKVKQLEFSLAQARAQDSGPDVTTAQVALERARIALDDTQDEYNKALDRPWEDQSIRDGWAKRLEQAQLDYRAAQAQLEKAQNGSQAHQAGLSILSAQLEQAQTSLADALVAQKTYSTTLDVLATDVEAARLQLEALQTWDNPYRDAALDEEIAQAEAMVEKARIAVDKIKLQLGDAELNAPFDGTVVDIQIEVGDPVTLQQVVVVLATLDRLEIHTTDLTELDVSQVQVQDPVLVTVDALPGREFKGTVHEIALQGKDYRGDVVYQVTVLLDEPPEDGTLRWGMTAMVEIEGR